MIKPHGADVLMPLYVADPSARELLFSEASDLTSITNPIIAIFSLPISGIHRSLPFYVHESLYIRAVYWVVNLFIQSAVVYLVILGLQRVRRKLKKLK